MARDRERGAALALTMVTVTALLGLGAITLLSLRAELTSAGASRFAQSALYAAESGVAAGIEWLRTSCSPTSMFSVWVNPGNATPLSPATIPGNGKRPGQAGNPFSADADTWYEVVVLNNPTDPGLGAGDDLDGAVILRAIGHGPGGSSSAVEVEIANDTCLETFCEQEYAQENVTSRNDAFAACSARVENGTLRTIRPGEAPAGGGSGGGP